LEDLFVIANRFVAREGQRELRVVRIEANDLRSDTEITYGAVILPPNLSGARGAADTPILDFIRHQHALGCTICSACAGLFWLGEAGLIGGRPVTTHWALEAEFLARFPKTNLATDQILIDDNDIVTAGGMMAWVDLGLFLVERFLGIDALTFTARQLLVDPRGRQQSNYRTFRPQLVHGDQTILRLQHWMESNFGDDLSVRALAKNALLSERTFIRKFKSATGLPPNRYVQALRVEKARALLEQTRRTVQDIGWTVGYQDISAFGRVFKSVTDTSPADYRHRFGVKTV
jgi:transcriptional regulator GlxA family with amidase domain